MRLMCSEQPREHLQPQNNGPRQRKFIALGTYSDSLFPPPSLWGFGALKEQLIYMNSMVRRGSTEQPALCRSHPPGLEQEGSALTASPALGLLTGGWQAIKHCLNQSDPYAWAGARYMWALAYRTQPRARWTSGGALS